MSANGEIREHEMDTEVYLDRLHSDTGQFLGQEVDGSGGYAKTASCPTKCWSAPASESPAALPMP